MLRSVSLHAYESSGERMFFVAILCTISIEQSVMVSGIVYIFTRFVVRDWS